MLTSRSDPCSLACGCEASVGRYFDSDGYLGQEEILSEFLKLVTVLSGTLTDVGIIGCAWLCYDCRFNTKDSISR